MSRKDKLRKFAELETFPNTFYNHEYRDPHLKNHQGQRVELKGHWHSDYFGNQHPIVLELACGKAEYSLNIARDYPQKNCVAMDLKGNRLWYGAKMALAQGLPNAAFIRSQIEYLPAFFAPEEVGEIWVVFADPQPNKPRKRLTSPRYLDIYRNLLGQGGIFHLKTDSDLLYEYTLEQLQQQQSAQWDLVYHCANIYAEPELYTPELAYKTFYEQQHLRNGRTIKYLRAIKRAEQV